MTCDSCGSSMLSSRQNHLYKECGLPFVTLQDVEVRRCPSCGETEVVIPRIEELHRAIASAIVTKKSRLTAPEVKFLRKHLGWSGADFASHMGVTVETVSRWENSHDPIGAVADRLLRLMVVTKEPMRDYSIDSLTNLKDSSEPSRIGLRSSPLGWESSDSLAA